jgi:hypothetical protein
MVAKNKGGGSSFSPETLEQDFQTEDLRRRVYNSSLTPAQLIIAENDRRAEENTDHLMNTVLCPHKGYGDHAFSIGDVSEDIAKYFDIYNSSADGRTINFYLIGGWIFVQRTSFPFVSEKLVAWSSTGKNRQEATESFLRRFDGQMQMKHALRLGHALHCRHVPVQELMEQYVFQTPCSVYH